jgi:hypothetical protein
MQNFYVPTEDGYKKIEANNKEEAFKLINSDNNNLFPSKKIEEQEAEEEEKDGSLTAGGAALELGIGAASNVAAAGVSTLLAPIPPAAAVAYFGINALGGFSASLARQLYDGGELSYGEMMAGATLNMFGPAKVAKTITSTTKITPQLIGKSAVANAEKGFVLGIVNANLVSVVDEGRFATEKENLDSGLLNAGVGLGYGLLSPYATKTFSKFINKTPREIDTDIANGKISMDELQLFENKLKQDSNQYSLFQDAMKKNIKDRQSGPVKPVIIPNQKEPNVIVNLDGVNVSIPKSQVDLVTQKTLEQPPKKQIQEELFSKEISPEVKRIVPSVQEKILSKEITAAFKRAEGDATLTTSVWDKAKAWLVPSVITGRGPQDEIFLGQKSNEAIKEEAGKVWKLINKSITSNPSIKEEVNKFLNYGAITPRLRKDPELLSNLNKWVERITPLQQRIFNQASIHEFSSMTNDEQQDFLKSGTRAFEKMGFYNTTQYESMTNKDFVFDNLLKQKAIIAETKAALNKSKDKPMSLAAARNLAENKINGLIQTSQNTRNIIGTVNVNSSVVYKDAGILQKLTDLTPETKKFMGEIVDPAERMRGTLVNLSSLAYKNQVDIGVIEQLKRNKLLVSERPNDNSFSELELPSIISTKKLYVPNVVNLALKNSYMGEMGFEANTNFLSFMQDSLKGSVAITKGSSVILNVASYAVNLYGGLSTILSAGVYPTPRNMFNYAKGLTLGFRKKLNDEVLELSKAGILAPSVLADDIRNVNDRNFIGKKVQQYFGPIGKIYSASDQAARYTLYKKLQRDFTKMYPKASESAINEATRLQTIDEMQMYANLNKPIKSLSQFGALPTFVAFQAALVRNHYHQTKNNSRMINGTFGPEYGLDPSTASKNAMRTRGLFRLGSQIATIAGTGALITAYNQRNDVTKEDEKAIRNFVPSWDKSKPLLITPSKDGSGDFKYTNAEYYVPQTQLQTVIEATKNGLSTDDIAKEAANILFDNYVGEGNIFINNIYQSATNRDSNGRPISTEPELAARAKDLIYRLISNTINPATFAGIDKAIKKDKPMAELFKQWSLGIRERDGNYFTSATFNNINHFKDLNLVKKEYTNKRDYGTNISPQELENIYNESARKHRIYWDRVLQVDKDLSRLSNSFGGTISQRAEVLKKAGFSNYDTLHILNGLYRPIDKEKEITAYSLWEDKYSNVKSSNFYKELQKDNLSVDIKKQLYKLRDKEEIKNYDNLDTKDSLFKELSSKLQLKFLRNNPQFISEYSKKGIINKKIRYDLRQEMQGE